jgi:hypothetical protein
MHLKGVELSSSERHVLSSEQLFTLIDALTGADTPHSLTQSLEASQLSAVLSV